MRKVFKLFVVLMLLSASAFADSWYICLGSFKRLDYASDYVNQLSKQGYSAVIEQTTVKDAPYYRVLLAQKYTDRNFARNKKDEFAKKLGKKDLWILSTDLKNTVKPQTKQTVKPAPKKEEPKPVNVIPLEPKVTDSAKNVVSTPAPVEPEVKEAPAVVPPFVEPAKNVITEAVPAEPQVTEPEVQEMPVEEPKVEEVPAPAVKEEPAAEIPAVAEPPVVEEPPVAEIEVPVVAPAVTETVTAAPSVIDAPVPEAPALSVAPAEPEVPAVVEEAPVEAPAETAPAAEIPAVEETSAADQGPVPNIEDMANPGIEKEILVEEAQKEEAAEETAETAQAEESEPAVPVATGPQPYSKEAPYAVNIRSFRQLADAENAKARLAEDGIETFIVSRAGKNAVVYNVAGGAFADKNEAYALIEELNGKNVKGAEILEYDSVESEIFAYSAMDSVYAVEGAAKAPLGLPDDMVSVLGSVPLFKNYEIEVVDLYSNANMAKDVTFAVDVKEVADVPFAALKVENKKILASAYVEYKDNMTGKKFAMSFKKAKKGYFSKLEKNLPKTDLSYGDAMLPGYNLHFVFFVSGESNVGVAKNGTGDTLYAIQSKDLSVQELAEIIMTTDQEKTASELAQIKRSMLSIPENKDYKKTIVRFGLNKLDASYAAARSSHEWAKDLVGNWHSVCQFKAKKVKGGMWTESFDLIYEPVAAKVYEAYSLEREKEDYVPMKVKGTPVTYYQGAEIDELTMRESSMIFITGSQRSDNVNKDQLKTISSQYKVFN